MKKTAVFLVLALLVSLLTFPSVAETEIVRRYGDVNSDGEINSTDGVLIARKLALWNVSSFDEEAADVNADDVFDSKDAVIFARYLAKWSQTGERVGEEIVPPAPPVAMTLEGKPITDYKIVIPDNTLSVYSDSTGEGVLTVLPDQYEGVDLPKVLAQNAANYINAEIEKLTGEKLDVITDASEDAGNEIVIGDVSRAISNAYDASALTGMQFSITANEEDVLLSGSDFLVAGAAYYFVNSLIQGNEEAKIDIPDEGIVAEPVPEKPRYFIEFIGDGMGQNHPRLLGSNTSVIKNKYLPMNHTFAGYLLPNQGLAKTYSADNEVTDSAAGGTALATSFKTNNGYVGVAPDGTTVLKSLTELSKELGYKTAVLSTDAATGATPAAFSAHVVSRKMETEILAMQKEMQESGTLDMLRCGFGDNYFLNTIDSTIRTLTADNEKGFYMMYEEAHIDKNSHGRNLPNTYWAMARGNMAIIKFMEFAMYHPDTMIVITADHETGGLTEDTYDRYKFTTTGTHTGADVPVIAYGVGTEIFNNATVDNTAIAKFFAKSLGYEGQFGDPDISAEPLS